MFDWTTTGTLALGCVAVLYIGQRALGNRVTYPFPPGPPGLPWVGNVIGVSRDAPWITYAEWARTYGRLRPVPIHVLHSYSCRWLNVYSVIGKGCHYHQFGKDCEGPARGPLQELFRPPILHRQ